jgi:hypothetical protein
MQYQSCIRRLDIFFFSLFLQDLGVPFIRQGREHAVNPAIHKDLSSRRIVQMSTVAEVESYYENSRVIATTCLSAGRFARLFDYCIVDEASQILEVCQLNALLLCL